MFLIQFSFVTQKKRKKKSLKRLKKALNKYLNNLNKT